MDVERAHMVVHPGLRANAQEYFDLAQLHHSWARKRMDDAVRRRAAQQELDENTAMRTQVAVTSASCNDLGAFPPTMHCRL